MVYVLNSMVGVYGKFQIVYVHVHVYGHVHIISGSPRGIKTVLIILILINT